MGFPVSINPNKNMQVIMGSVTKSPSADKVMSSSLVTVEVILMLYKSSIFLLVWPKFRISSKTMVQGFCDMCLLRDQ